MPSERPRSEPPRREPDPAPGHRTTAVRDGTLVFALVLAVFVAYTFGTPTTYRATAVVNVQPEPGVTGLRLPDAIEASARLRRAALEPSLVAELAKEEKAKPSETPVALRLRIESSLVVESGDARRFTFAATASTPERSQRVVNAFAQHAAKRAAQVLDPPPPEVDPAEKAKNDLLEFLAAHPAIAAEPSQVPAHTGPDPLISALRAERARIEAKLAAPAPTSENPYEERGPLDNPESLRRRLREIESTLEARTKPRTPAPASSKGAAPTAEERAEWQRLLKVAAESSKTEPSRAPQSRLRVTLASAVAPQLPIEPDRPRVLLIGLVVSGLAGFAAAFLRGILESRDVRRYGIKTGAHPIAELPNTTLRIARDQLPKPAAPQSHPPQTPVPEAPARPLPSTEIPPAPRLPAPTTPVPPPPIAPTPITSIAPAGALPAPATPVPPPGDPKDAKSAAPREPDAPREDASKATPAPEPDAGKPVTHPTPMLPAPMTVAGPSPDAEGPPTTQDYGTPGQPLEPNKVRRTTKIYGTPPQPTSEGSTNPLRTTQAYGSMAIEPYRPSATAESQEAIAAEVLPAQRTSSLKPSPMIPLGGNSSTPAVAARTRSSGPPLIETAYSYVSTPVPPPQRSPHGEASPPQTPFPRPARIPADAVIVPHSVKVEWRPDASLSPTANERLFPQILAAAVDRSFVLAVCGTFAAGQPQAHVACEIALGLSALGHPRVLLLEGDLNFPRVHKLMSLDVPMIAGFSRQVLARVKSNADRQWHVIQCSPSLHVLAEGVLRSPGLLLSKQFEEAVKELRAAYDVVVISAPSVPSESEARALSDVVDGAVIVQAEDTLGTAPELSRHFARHRFVRSVAV